MPIPATSVSCPLFQENSKATEEMINTSPIADHNDLLGVAQRDGLLATEATSAPTTPHHTTPAADAFFASVFFPTSPALPSTPAAPSLSSSLFPHPMPLFMGMGGNFGVGADNGGSALPPSLLPPFLLETLFASSAPVSLVDSILPQDRSRTVCRQLFPKESFDIVMDPFALAFDEGFDSDDEDSEGTEVIHEIASDDEAEEDTI